MYLDTCRRLRRRVRISELSAREKKDLDTREAYSIGLSLDSCAVSLWVYNRLGHYIMLFELKNHLGTLVFFAPYPFVSHSLPWYSIYRGRRLYQLQRNWWKEYLRQQVRRWELWRRSQWAWYSLDGKCRTQYCEYEIQCLCPTLKLRSIATHAHFCSLLTNQNTSLPPLDVSYQTNRMVASVSFTHSYIVDASNTCSFFLSFANPFFIFHFSIFNSLHLHRRYPLAQRKARCVRKGYQGSWYRQEDWGSGIRRRWYPQVRGEDHWLWRALNLWLERK